MTVDREELLNVALAAAKDAGNVLLEKARTGFDISLKGRANLVTEADLLAEKVIVDQILARFPDHKILAEERGETGGQAPVKWVIDPLDGTTNYAHQYPCYCVSIGCEVEEVVLAGVVFDPVSGECFTATKGGGAFLNGEAISVSKIPALEDCLLVTGFSYGEEEVRQNLELFNTMMLRSRSVRRDGSAALDLCSVACGRFDGFWELSLYPWDMAAGGLIVEEAGGNFTRFDGSEVSIYDRECLATNGKIHDEIGEILTANYPTS
jgi:myo-inositol-1(or 4)-monophosphatase